MALAISILSVEPAGDAIRILFNVTPSGNYVTGGDTLDFTKASQDAAFIGLIAAIESSQAPISLDVWDAGGNLANGVFPVLGTTQANSKLKFTSAFNTELAAAGYPGSITGSKLQGEAVFHRNL
jgi:hypothetical protein